VKAVVMISSKEDNFIAGADINMLQSVENKSELKDMCMEGHAFYDKIKKSKKPVIAAINGACLGAGLEWAMYCDYRIATTSSRTVLGLPEVKIGLMPGLAGTYHLPKLIGYPDALDCILTGKHLRSDKAKKMGLVDLVVDVAALESVAITQAQGIVSGKIKTSKPKTNYMSLAIQYVPFVRDYVFKQARDTVDKQSGGHYPAPYAILDVIKGTVLTL
jgi:enoyl-CoA hydratase/long-chain 3-hydroxyacyl-CoA dehydrogenase